MPRSKRTYGDPSPATLANAIAYVHITQQTKGLHMSTLAKLMDLYTFAYTRPHYRFDEATLKLAEAAPLWAAHQWLKTNGFRLRQMARHDMRSIEFWNPAAEQIAYANRYGDVFITPERGLWCIDGVDQTRRFNPSKGEQ